MAMTEKFRIVLVSSFTFGNVPKNTVFLILNKYPRHFLSLFLMHEVSLQCTHSARVARISQVYYIVVVFIPEGAVAKELVGLFVSRIEASSHGAPHAAFGSIFHFVCTGTERGINHDARTHAHHTGQNEAMQIKNVMRKARRTSEQKARQTQHSHVPASYASWMHGYFSVSGAMKVIWPNSTKFKGRSNWPVGIATRCGLIGRLGDWATKRGDGRGRSSREGKAGGDEKEEGLVLRKERSHVVVNGCFRIKHSYTVMISTSALQSGRPFPFNSFL